jgi:NADH dehydrogenase FAD-containing subunit
VVAAARSRARRLESGYLHSRSVEENAVTLSYGSRIDTNTLVWTAGIRPHPLVEQLGLPVDERHGVIVDDELRVAIWTKP